MRRFLSLVACLSACAACAPAPAPAQGVLTPPGASGVDEYSETIPGADGNHTVGGPGGGHALTPRQRHALERLGPDGRQAAALADASGPARAGSSSAGSPSRPGAKTSPPSPQSPSAASSRLPASGG